MKETQIHNTVLRILNTPSTHNSITHVCPAVANESADDHDSGSDSTDCLLGTSLAADRRDNDPPLDSFMLTRLRNGRLQLLKLSRTWHIAISLYNARCSEVVFNRGHFCELHVHANLLPEINDEVHLLVHSHHTIPHAMRYKNHTIKIQINTMQKHSIQYNATQQAYQ